MKKLLLTTLAGFAFTLCVGQQQANRIDKKDKSCNCAVVGVITNNPISELKTT